MQLAFAAARKPASSNLPRETKESPANAITVPASKPTVEEYSTKAAGGRQPWGYGSGPFAGISATASDVFEQGWAGESGEKYESGDAQKNEDFTIAQLEVRNKDSFFVSSDADSRR